MALMKIGVPAAPILPDIDGAPQWPAGVVGSMTHCAGYRAAAVTRSRALAGVGIDAEPHAPLPGAVHDVILREEERSHLLTLAEARRELHWDRILFCAKEAVYKAVVSVDSAMAGLRGRVGHAPPRRHLRRTPACP